MAKSPAEMEAAVLKNIPAKTGKTLDQWLAVIKTDGPEDVKKIRGWLKETYGFGNGQAGILSHYYSNGGKTSYNDGEALLDMQYSGDKAAFRPLYDKLTREVGKLDKDIRFEPCRTYVSIIAKNQFAIAQVTKSEIRLGLALAPEVPENEVLKKAKNLGTDKVTHYVALKLPDDIKYAMGFVKEAYSRYRNTKKDIS